MTYDWNAVRSPTLRAGQHSETNVRLYRYGMLALARTMLTLVIVLLVGFTDSTSHAQDDAATDISSQTVAAVDPNTLVLNAVQRAVWGKSLSCRVHQETYAFGQTMTGLGQYAHNGGGNGQVSLVIRYSSARSQSTFYQLSDGRMLWSVSNDGTAPTRVYLDSVRQALGGFAASPEAAANTSLYLAIGGQAETLRALYHRYRWFKIWAAEVQGEPVWQIVGTLRGSMPEPHSQTRIDMNLFNPTPSSAVPSDVRVTMGRGGERDLVPFKLEYFYRELDDHGQLAEFKPVSTITYSDIQVGTYIDDSEFTFSDKSIDSVDETAEYMPLYPIAAIPGQTTRR